MNTGEKIKQYREKAKLTRKVLASAVDITEDGLFKIERGDRNPSFELVKKIAEVLHISLDELK
ncbi:MAG: helix-turn-helix transcriptional regulator [Candidatus Margulisiibacteriota bacterium]|jgi:DNA-binding XRE family transcriptional regulator